MPSRMRTKEPSKLSRRKTHQKVVVTSPVMQEGNDHASQIPKEPSKLSRRQTHQKVVGTLPVMQEGNDHASQIPKESSKLSRRQTHQKVVGTLPVIQEGNDHASQIPKEPSKLSRRQTHWKVVGTSPVIREGNDHASQIPKEPSKLLRRKTHWKVVGSSPVIQEGNDHASQIPKEPSKLSRRQTHWKVVGSSVVIQEGNDHVSQIAKEPSKLSRSQTHWKVVGTSLVIQEGNDHASQIPKELLKLSRRQTHWKVIGTSPIIQEGNDHASQISKEPSKLLRRQTHQKVVGTSLVVQEGNDHASRIPDELHELFLSKKEEKGSTKFRDFFSSEAPIIAISVPGQLFGDEKYLKFSDTAMMSSAALVDWLIVLKDAGYSLSGCFNASDFAITYFGHFKGQRSLIEKLTNYKVKRGKMDMSAGADLIENDICSGVAELPAEVLHLLALLRDFKEKNSFIIRHHASLYNELGKEVIFSSMFGRFKKLQKLNKTKYQKIQERIPYCKKGDRWENRVQRNKYLAAVLSWQNPLKLNRKNPPNRKVKVARVICTKYNGHGGELLRFRRNGQQHLPDSSVVKQPSSSTAGTKKPLRRSAASTARSQQVAKPGLRSSAVSPMVELYGPEDSEHMFAVAFPELLVKFQMAMSDQGEVESLGWHEPSRGRRLR